MPAISVNQRYKLDSNWSQGRPSLSKQQTETEAMTRVFGADYDVQNRTYDSGVQKSFQLLPAAIQTKNSFNSQTLSS